MPLDDIERASLESGPIEPAFRWLRALENDAESAWTGVDDDLRLWFALRWVEANPAALHHPVVTEKSPEAFAAALAASGQRHPLFPSLWRVTRRGLIEALGPFLGQELSASVRPRPLAPGLEVVRLFQASDLPPEEDGIRLWQPGVELPSLVLVMSQHGEGWRVHAPGAWLPVTSWPPALNELDPALLD